MESSETKIRKRSTQNTQNQEKSIESSKENIVLATKPKSELSSIILLILLYLLQGIPTGLAMGSLPYLLKSKLSYSEIGLFSLSGYPYSLKLFWSPIVDLVHVKRFGRRKTWIIPLQIVISFMMYLVGKNMEVYFNNNFNIINFTVVFFVLVFLAATQDIAVDGWALTLLSEENIGYASTCQTIGLNTGYFLSFTILLALLSPEFCNTYLRTIPQDIGVITLGGYMKFWSIFYILITLLTFFKKEHEDHGHDEYSSIKQGYKNIYEIMKLKNMQDFMIILFVCKIGFMANESITPLKMLELGLKKEDLALSVLIDFPFQIIFGYLAAKWSSNTERPLKPWLYAFYARLVMSFLSIFVVYYFPTKITKGFMGIVIISIVFSSFTSTVMFVSMSAFFNKIADPIIGGTYMTLLNTISNFGGTWPKFFVLELVDMLTKKECQILHPTTKKLQTIVPDLKCISETDITKCTTLNGSCVTIKDGYYVVSFICLFIGITSLLLFINKKVAALEKLPLSRWKLKRK